jgi:hypothetical protein
LYLFFLPPKLSEKDASSQKTKEDLSFFQSLRPNWGVRIAFIFRSLESSM